MGYTIADGALTVDRGDREPLRVDLAEVTDVSFMRSGVPDSPGSLVLVVTGDRRHVVSVPNEDGPAAVREVLDHVTGPALDRGGLLPKGADARNASAQPERAEPDDGSELS